MRTCAAWVHLSIFTVLCGELLIGGAVRAASFPGAAGHGASSVGGRGGAVVYVTNLADSGPGTLREALEKLGPRTVIFRVGGTITLQRPLVIRNPYVTVAGQTAPGGGIQLRNDPVAPYGLARDSFTSLVIDTHDVVIRFLRIRPGPLEPNPRCTGKDALGVDTCVDAYDIQAIEMYDNAQRVMLDHLSLFWSSDELVDINGSKDVTIQWSILAEPINFVLYDGFHYKPSPYNGHGVITGGLVTAQRGETEGRLAFHHNLFALVGDRAPQVQVNCPTASNPLTCASDIVNNYVYDWRHSGALVSNMLGHGFYNIVGNYFRDGRDSESVDSGLRMIDWGSNSTAVVPDARLGVHQAGNLRWQSGASVPIEPKCTRWNQVTRRSDTCSPASYASPRYATPPIVTTDAVTARNEILRQGGASRRIDATGRWRLARDTTDVRVISDAKVGTGRLIDSLAEFPGWPNLASGTAPTDTDRDGMPDAFEDLHQCLDATRYDGNLDANRDGYTNLEEYLNGDTPCS